MAVTEVKDINGEESGKGDDMILNIADLERQGSSKMNKMYREFYASGALEQTTFFDIYRLKANLDVFLRFKLRPRCLVDVSNVDTSTIVFGKKIKFPLCISPTAVHKAAHPDGELATSRAAANHDIAMGVSSFASIGLEEVIKAGEGRINYAIQAYILRNRTIDEELIRMAEKAGYKAILLTSDSPILGTRWNETRNALALPPGVGFPIIGKAMVAAGFQTKDLFASLNDDSQNWDRDIPWLRSITKLQIWIKGVLTAEDVHLAISHGVDGILVSNHGARQLDGAPATLEALPECVAAAAGRIPIHIDGGFRRGSDIFKALALGASCCWIGRPVIWGLSYDGQAGVELALSILHEEFMKCMQLMGCRTVKDIRRSHLAVLDSRGFLEVLKDL